MEVFAESGFDASTVLEELLQRMFILVVWLRITFTFCKNHLVGRRTDGSGRQWPIGGSGAIGAPSSIREQCSMVGIDSSLPEISLPVSWARVIVDLTILSQLMSSVLRRSPVNSAC